MCLEIAYGYTFFRHSVGIGFSYFLKHFKKIKHNLTLKYNNVTNSKSRTKLTL